MLITWENPGKTNRSIKICELHSQCLEKVTLRNSFTKASLLIFIYPSFTKDLKPETRSHSPRG